MKRFATSILTAVFVLVLIALLTNLTLVNFAFSQEKIAEVQIFTGTIQSIKPSITINPLGSDGQPNMSGPKHETMLLIELSEYGKTQFVVTEDKLVKANFNKNESIKGKRVKFRCKMADQSKDDNSFIVDRAWKVK